MGWWKVQGTNDTIGDAPLDAVGTAIAAVLVCYQDAWSRRPTRSEWEAILTAVLGAEEEGSKPLDQLVVTRVVLQVE